MKKLIILILLTATLSAVEKTYNEGEKMVLGYVVAAGTPPFTQQWFKDGVPIVGEKNETYIVRGILPEHAGLYSVKVMNSAGATISDNAVITVKIRPAGAVVVAVPEPTPVVTP